MKDTAAYIISNARSTQNQKPCFWYLKTGFFGGENLCFFMVLGAPGTTDPQKPQEWPLHVELILGHLPRGVTADTGSSSNSPLGKEKIKKETPDSNKFNSFHCITILLSNKWQCFSPFQEVLRYFNKAKNKQPITCKRTKGSKGVLFGSPKIF